MAAAIRLSQQHSCSFDDLVGAREQRRRHVDTERLGGRDVDRQVELGGQFDRQVARLFTFENPTHIDAGAPVSIFLTRSVAHEATSFDKLAYHIDRGNRMAGRQRNGPSTLSVEKWTGANK